jgi:hypothetical protein
MSKQKTRYRVEADCHGWGIDVMVKEFDAFDLADARRIAEQTFPPSGGWVLNVTEVNPQANLQPEPAEDFPFMVGVI